MVQATRSRADSPSKTCTYAGCAKPLRAKGYCSGHYRQFVNPDKRVQVPCAQCGALLDKHLTGKYANRFCDYTCRDEWRRWNDAPRVCVVPGTHRSRSCKVPAGHPARVTPTRPGLWISGPCAWCGAQFMHRSSAGSTPTSYCSRTCKHRAGRRRRRANEAGATGFYSWDGFMRLAMSLGNCCAYCGARPTEPLEPDHVLPISRGGHNGLGNILPACKSCNGAKRDQLLHEWAADRVRLGLPARRTDVSGYIHLTAHDHSSLAA